MHDHPAMDPVFVPIILRLVERIAAVAVGGMMVYLGYRLFSEVRGKGDSAGQFSLGSGKSIKLSKVGPGVFFALFGTGLIVVSFMRGVEVSRKDGAASDHADVTFRGATSIPGTDAERDEMRSRRRHDIAALNRAAEKARPALNAADLDPFERALREAKLALMEPLWGADWGPS